MTNEEFQKLVLEKLTSLENGQTELRMGQEEIKRELKFVWEDIKRLDNRLERQEIKVKNILP